MDSVNAGMRRFFDLVWAPFDRLPAWIGLLVLGVVFGILALIVMKYTTDAKRIDRFKGRYQGHILAIKLFRDSLTVVVGSLVKTLGWVGCYLGEQFKPMFVLLIPFMLLFAQMQMRLGYRPIELGRTVLVKVGVAADRAPAGMTVGIDLPAGVELAAKPVREPREHRVVVPVVAKAAGAHVLRFTCGGETVEKTLHAGAMEGAPFVSPVRSNSWWDRVLYPAEPSFAAGSAFTRVELAYPVRPLPCFGVDLSFGADWGMAVVFVVITIVVAFALKGVFGVTI